MMSTEDLALAVELLPPVLIFLLLSGVLGIPFARRPLDRKGYWLRIAAQTTMLIAIAFGAPNIFYFLPILALSPANVYAIRISVAVIYLALFSYGFQLEARRMLDAGYSRWWALLGAIPFAFIAFGLPRSRSGSTAMQEQIAKTFD